MMQQVKKYPFLVFLFVLLVTSYLYFKKVHTSYRVIDSFEACSLAGFLVTEGEERVCHIPGKRFFEKKKVAIPKDTLAKNTLLDEYRNLAYFVGEERITMHNGVGEIKDTIGTTTYRILDPPLLVSGTTTNKAYIFFLVEKTITPFDKKSASPTLSYYVGGGESLLTSSIGLNLIPFASSLITSPLLMYQNNTFFVSYFENGVQKYKYYKNKDSLFTEVSSF